MMEIGFVDLVSREGIIPFQKMIQEKDVKRCVVLLEGLQESLSHYRTELIRFSRMNKCGKQVDFNFNWLKPLQRDCIRLTKYIKDTKEEEFNEEDHGEKLLSVALRTYLIRIYMNALRDKICKVA